MNPCLILTHNNLELTKRCVESTVKQDVPVEFFIVDNGSIDETVDWLADHNASCCLFDNNKGVSVGWNSGLEIVFNRWRMDYCLIVGNDTILPPYFYSALLSVNKAFVTGVDMGMDPLPAKPDVLPLSPHPDFSAFLIRRECWEKVGEFDERMVNYCGDTDYHVRAHRLGIPLWKASVPYQHERSSTMNRAPLDERVKLNEQAHRDREVFKSIYGCLPGTKEYEQLFER